MTNIRKDTWDPAQYEKFLHHRSLPFFDLLALVMKRPGMRVVDLGCGTGEWTARIHRDLEAKETLGVDASEAMLAKSAAFVCPGLRFERGEIAAFRPAAPVDLIFSNAALHFVPDHPTLLARWREFLSPGGQIAIQIPANQDYPTHRVAADLAREEPFRHLLDGYVLPDNRLEPVEYAHLFESLGFLDQHVRLQVYGHRLPNRDEVVEWVRGSFLNEYKARLSSDDFDRFFAVYRGRLLEQLPDQRPFFLTYKRVLLWAQRPETESV